MYRLPGERRSLFYCVDDADRINHAYQAGHADHTLTSAFPSSRVSSPWRGKVSSRFHTVCHIDHTDRMDHAGHVGHISRIDHTDHADHLSRIGHTDHADHIVHLLSPRRACRLSVEITLVDPQLSRTNLKIKK